jgi:hypothetical protein
MNHLSIFIIFFLIGTSIVQIKANNNGKIYLFKNNLNLLQFFTKFQRRMRINMLYFNGF